MAAVALECRHAYPFASSVERAGNTTRSGARPRAGHQVRPLGQAPAGCGARMTAPQAAFVRDLVERVLRGLPTPPPADLGPLLALLRELCGETSKPMHDPEARAKLAMLDGAGAPARLARALLDAAPAA